jgi:hypothetical protein
MKNLTTPILTTCILLLIMSFPLQTFIVKYTLLYFVLFILWVLTLFPLIGFYYKLLQEKIDSWF